MLPWYVFAFLSAFFLGILSLVDKKILMHEHALEFLSGRAPLVFLISLVLIPFITIPSSSTFLIIYFVSVIVTAGSIYFNKSIRHGEISLLSPMTNINPLFILVFAYLFLGEVPTMKQYSGIFLLVLGTYVLEVGVRNTGFLEPIAHFFKSKVIHNLILGLLAFSIASILDKKILGNGMDVITYLFFFFIFISLNFVLLDIYRFGVKELIKNVKENFKLHLLSAVMVFLTHSTYLLAVSIPASQISLIIPIRRTSSLFTTFFGGKLFHEHNLLVKTLASIIMIWGAIFILL